MPIPEPHKHETKEKFLSRCMADEVMNKEYPQKAQRFAICHSKWSAKAGFIERVCSLLLGKGKRKFDDDDKTSN